MVEPLKMLSGRGIGARLSSRENNWGQRGIWPAEDPDYIFMGRAIDQVGRILFPDTWNGLEPQGLPTWPPPLRPMNEATDSQRAEVAMAIPRTRQHFRHGEIISYNKGDTVPDLTEQEWAAEDEARASKRAASLASHERWRSVVETMDWPLRRQDIDTYTRGKNSTHFSQVDDKSWSIDDMEGRFLTLRMNPRAANDTSSTERGWIYFGRESFEAFLRRMQGIPQPKISAPYIFERDADHFSLYDAILWTATGGEDTTTGEIAEQDLDEAGAQMLFPLLCRDSAPQVTGLDVNKLREHIPREYWELMHIENFGTDQKGHTISFSGGLPVVANLTPYRHTKPKWTDLRIASRDLFALIPKPKKTTAKNLVPEQRAFRNWFHAKVEASPQVRTLTYAADIKPWLDQNAPSLSTRCYREIRKIVLDDFPGHGWGQNG
jgi:hypothetical protein